MILYATRKIEAIHVAQEVAIELIVRRGVAEIEVRQQNNDDSE